MSRSNDTFWPISRQPRDLVDRADKYCQENYMNRSQFTRQAIFYYLDSEEKLKNEK